MAIGESALHLDWCRSIDEVAILLASWLAVNASVVARFRFENTKIHERRFEIDRRIEVVVLILHD